MNTTAACAAYLSQYKPDHLVIIGCNEQPPASPLAAEQVSVFQNWASFAASEIGKNSASARVAGMLVFSSELAPPALDLALGAATRAFPWHLLVEDCAEAEHQNTAFFALGFRELSALADVPRPQRLFEYRLQDYKRAPEWLNSRFWAHPERFNAVD